MREICYNHQMVKQKIFFVILVSLLIISSVGIYCLVTKGGSKEDNKKQIVDEKCPVATPTKKIAAYGNKYKLGYLGVLKINEPTYEDNLSLVSREEDWKNYPMTGGPYSVEIKINTLGYYVDYSTGENLLGKKIGEKVKLHKEIWLKLSEKSVAGITQMTFSQTEMAKDFEGSWGPNYISVWTRGNEVYEMSFSVLDRENFRKYKSEFEKFAESFEFIY